jgi:hypothetical protein
LCSSSFFRKQEEIKVLDACVQKLKIDPKFGTTTFDFSVSVLAKYMSEARAA